MQVRFVIIRSMTKNNPKVLYHSSPNINIDIFEPRNVKVRDPEEGPVVFATPDKALAAAFLVRTDGSWVKIGRFTDGQTQTPWHLVTKNKRRFRRRDKGGAIYHLPAAGFSSDLNKGMGDMEWTSRESVRPLKKDAYTSGEQAMKDLGVNVYFVDRKTFKAINESNDHGRSIILGLEPDSGTI